MVWVTPPAVCPTALWTFPVPEAALHNQPFTAHSSAGRAEIEQEMQQGIHRNPWASLSCVCIPETPSSAAAAGTSTTRPHTQPAFLLPKSIWYFCSSPMHQGHGFGSRDHHLWDEMAELVLPSPAPHLSLSPGTFGPQLQSEDNPIQHAHTAWVLLAKLLKEKRTLAKPFPAPWTHIRQPSRGSSPAAAASLYLPRQGEAKPSKVRVGWPKEPPEKPIQRESTPPQLTQPWANLQSCSRRLHFLPDILSQLQGSFKSHLVSPARGIKQLIG